MISDTSNDLPQFIQEIAELRRQEYKESHNGQEYSISGYNKVGYAFLWSATPEGHIWSEVDGGKYESFYRFHENKQSLLGEINNSYSII